LSPSILPITIGPIELFTTNDPYAITLTAAGRLKEQYSETFGYQLGIPKKSKKACQVSIWQAFFLGE
jgi:hypothetical protein